MIRRPPRSTRTDTLFPSTTLFLSAFAEARRLHGDPVTIDEAVPHLSPRRLECLRWAAIGRTDEQIALIMDAKVSTIRTHMADLRRLFGVCSRTELARAAQRAGLIGIDDEFP